jgi:DNA-binding MarR family transcriptional regulator
MKEHLYMCTKKRNENQSSSQKVEPGYPSRLETGLWVALNLAQRSVYKIIDAELKAKDLPPLRWYDILWSIERSAEGGIQAIELRKGLLFEQSNLSRLLRKIIEEGLVEEAVHEKDRRGKLLRITAKGREIRLAMWEIYGPLIHDNMSKIASRKTEGLTAELGKLHDGWSID